MWREGVGAVRRRVGYAPGGVGWPRTWARTLSQERSLRPIESLFHCDTVSVAYEVGDWHDALGAQSSLEPQTSSSRLCLERTLGSVRVIRG